MMYVCLLGVHTLCMCLLEYIHCVYVSTRVHILCACVYLGTYTVCMCLLGVHILCYVSAGVHTLCVCVYWGYKHCMYVSTRVHILCVCVYWGTYTVCMCLLGYIYCVLCVYWEYRELQVACFKPFFIFILRHGLTRLPRLALILLCS